MANFFRLAGAGKQSRIRFGALALDQADNLQTGATGQQVQLIQTFGIVWQAEIE
jgi:hypothetical protein